MKKAKKVLMLVALLSVIGSLTLAGCAALDVYKEIKDDPKVHDVSVIVKGDHITCSIILEKYVDTKGIEGMAEKYAGSVDRAIGDDKEILVQIVKDREVMDSYTIESR